MTITIKVGFIGFSVLEEDKFKKIFEFSRQHERSYKISTLADTEPVELLIVKKSDESVLREQYAYQARFKNNRIPIITVGREPISGDDSHYIRGVLVPSRVFSVLDKIALYPAQNDSIVEAKENATAKNNSFHPTTVTAETIKPLQVLVVDDSVMMQKTIQLELNKATMLLETNFADTGEIALEKIKLKKYDFIFLDVMMPGIDGFETCTQIRKLEGMAKTPIIMLTSKTSALDEVKGLMAGCTTYLTKPFEHDEFHKMLERIVHWVKEFNEKK